MSSFMGETGDAIRHIERKVLRKLDAHILPPLALLWLANFIDRSNIGNARVSGLEASLHLHNTQFNTALAVFYAAYVISEIPSNLVLKKMRPNRWLPSIVMAWGLVTMLSGFVQNYAGLLAIRIVLGLCEGGLLPGMVLYLSTIYKRHELQMRIGIFYSFASLAGAFGGLLAAAITKLDGKGNLAGWRWIFVLEGLATILIGAGSAFFLPESLATARFLTPEEKDFAITRFNADQTPHPQPRAHAVDQKDEIIIERKDSTSVEPESPPAGNQAELETEEFEWREVQRAILDVQTWLTALSYLGLLTSLYSYSLFLPTIVKGMGYSGTRTQLLSVPPYILPAFLTVVIAFLADRYKARMTFVLMLLIPSIIGYVVAITAESNSVRYGAVFLMAAGIYPAVPCILTILPNNHKGHYKRATSTALQLAVANCAGFIATFAYTPPDAPAYKRGHSIVLSFLVFSWICMGLNLGYCILENRARSSGRRNDGLKRWKKEIMEGKTKAPVGDRDPSFLFTL